MFYQDYAAGPWLCQELGSLLLPHPLPTRRRRCIMVAEPEDLVGPMLLLASEAGGYLTGQTITVDSGQLMM